jgi:hypothetical protein
MGVFLWQLPEFKTGEVVEFKPEGGCAGCDRTCLFKMMASEMTRRILTKENEEMAMLGQVLKEVKKLSH